MIPTEILRRSPCFAGIGDDTLLAIGEFSEQRSYAAGTELCIQGQRAEKLYILLDGRADILLQSTEGERRAVQSLGAGDVLCWSAVIEPHELTATCVTREPCEVLEIDGLALRQICARDCLLGYRIMHQVARELARRLRSWLAPAPGPGA